MGSTRLFPEENAYLAHYDGEKNNHNNNNNNNGIQSCSCCPYGYHIDLDFVRYIESLENANPSERELQRRHNRRSRKSMEFMLGVENLSLDQWDMARMPELYQDNNNNSNNNNNNTNLLTPPNVTSPTYGANSLFALRPRSASVPRFTYHNGLVRPDSPFGTASSTCSSVLGAESDVPYSLYQRRQRKYQQQQQQHPAETHAFLQDALEDVCSDFERTLERASGRRKKHNTTHLINGDRHFATKQFDDYNNNNNNNNNNTNQFWKKPYSTWERKNDFLDSCISGNKSPRSSVIYQRSNTLPYLQNKPTAAEQKYESYVKATVAANSTTAVDEELRQLVPPPPPPRKHTLNRTRSPAVSQTSEIDGYEKPLAQSTPTAVVKETTVVETATAPDAQTLYNIRQQMALSLKRMRELEEQVKTIPALQLEVQNLREEKRRLELSHPMRTYESPSPLLSPKYNTVVTQFNSASLESLGARLRTSSSSSGERRAKSVMKRDIGVNCTQTKKRDICVGGTTVITRSVSTDAQQKLHIDERLYTQAEMSKCVESALKNNNEKRLLNMVTKSTQMQRQWEQLSNVSTQTNAAIERKHCATLCKPETRTVGSSEHCVTDILCEKCLVKKCHMACGTDDDENRKSWVSLKTLDMPYTRSNTFSLGEQERLNLVIRKSVGTQFSNGCELVDKHCQTSKTQTMSVGTQKSAQEQHASTQTRVEQNDQETDTKGLVSLCLSETNTEEVSTPVPQVVVKEVVKPLVCHQGSNTERVYTRERGENTEQVLSSTRHTASNTDEVAKRDIACGDIVKPHISIACAENYCDSCKDTIKNLAKDFSKVQSQLLSPMTQRASESRIPRPKHLSSPSPIRKPIHRQNTYTISPSPTPSPVWEKKSGPSSLPTSFYREKSFGETKVPTSSKKVIKQATVSNSNESLSKNKNLAAKIEQQRLSPEDPLIVREETRVSICWSREASPLPTPTGIVETKELPNNITKEECEETKSSQNSQQTNSTVNEELPVETSEAVKIVSSYTIPLDVLTAMKTFNDSLLKKMGAKPLSSASLKTTKSAIQQEWFRVSSTEDSNPLDLQVYLEKAEKMSLQLLEYCVNLTDNNGNTALHYAVSHGNFDIVSILLDSKVCDVNQMNNAGYTSVMLVSLAKLKNSNHRAIVERLFRMADINIRAKKHCQTALMLAVTHGNLDMVEMLLAAGADINVQDEDGSTALMCAAEHGRVDIVKHLLSQTECDSLIQDVDGSTAFKIAWQGGHKDVGLMLYVHEQMLRSKLPQRAEVQRQSLQTSLTDKK